MYVLIVVLDRPKRSITVRLVNEDGAVAYSAPSVHAALSWLWLHGEREVVAYTDDGPELFQIETCDHPAMRLPSVSLRRSHLGGCCDLPKLRGLGADLADGAEVLEDRPETPQEGRRRRKMWVRRATGPAANDNPR